jgi:ferric-dicitrate binding protein FerR (iron transport regulator)
MKNGEDMYLIMAKILGNEASLSEKTTFRTWLKESFEHQTIWEDTQMIWQQKNADGLFNSQKAWRKLLPKMQ